MFGVEYSKDNFTLLRFTKPQLGLNEHVCVYRGGKGEHTVSFFSFGELKSFVIPATEPAKENSPYVKDLQALSVARLAFEMNDKRASRRCERLVDMVCDAASRVLPEGLPWRLVVTPISEIAVMISGVFVGNIKVGIFGPNIELTPDWGNDIPAIRGALQEDESLHEVKDSFQLLERSIKEKAARETSSNKAEDDKEDEDVSKDDLCPFCESSWYCECRDY
nr:MAG TPA: hypothetical protein [Caudoviricetes sp.]